MPEFKEFRVNEYITLKLENNKTNIYIKDELFQQCKFLMINIPIEEAKRFNQINSIDDAVELLDGSLEEGEGFAFNISAEVEFWAHSSNLQVWSEHKYDTRLLHSNLAFALLRKLYEKGDSVAEKKLKEEIVKRFIYGNDKIQDFLIEEGFLDIVSKEEVLSAVDDSDIIFKLEKSLGKKLEINTPHYPSPKGIVIEDAEIEWLSLDTCELKTVPEIVRELKSLKGLILQRNHLEILPDWIGELSSLEFLYVSDNQLEEIPESIGNLQKLRRLELQHNKLRKIPDSIGNLLQLEYLNANDNRIKALPESIGNLVKLQDLIIPTNLIETLPESIGYMSSLESLYLSGNPIKKIPSTINHLGNLRVLYLKGIDNGALFLSSYSKKKIKIYR